MGKTSETAELVSLSIKALDVGDITKLIEAGSRVPEHLFGAGSKLAETWRHNAERKFLNAQTKELPELSRMHKDALKAEIDLMEVQRAATFLNTRAFQQTASVFQGAAQSVRNDAESVAKCAGDVGSASQRAAAAVEEAVCSGIQNASKMTASFEAMSKAHQGAAAGMQSTARSAQSIARDVNGIHVVANSALDRLARHCRFMETMAASLLFEVKKGAQALVEIAGRLEDQNNLHVAGGTGPDGYARVVYDFIKMEMDAVSVAQAGDGAAIDQHMFFLYLPDTAWWGAFHRLLAADPLPSAFCARGYCLDKLCRTMMAARAALREQNRGDVKFHLLIPAWTRVVFREPLHFPVELQPLRVVGVMSKGKSLVEMNLPKAPQGLLDRVSNVVDPNGYNATVEAVAALSGLAAGGWGANGACLALGLGAASATGLGLFIIVPIWWGGALLTMVPTAQAVDATIRSVAMEGPPRILGTNDLYNP